MDALIWHGGADVAIGQVEPPQPAAGEVVVDIELTGICGSDLHAYRGHGGARTPPLVLGHEAVGRVAGDDTLYALFPLRGCGQCPACARGAENLCTRRRLLGLDRPGTFAQQVAIASDDLVAVPAGVTPELAALAEPLATAINAVDALQLPGPSRIAVIGLGAIGLLAAYAARSRGCDVVGVDPAPVRRRHASELGVVDVAASTDELAAQSFDGVVDAVGVSATWSAGIAAVAAGGCVAVVGLGESTGPIDIGRMVRAALTVRGTYAYTRDQFHYALQMLAQDPPSTAWIERLPLADGARAFEQLASVSTDATKVLLEVEPSQ